MFQQDNAYPHDILATHHALQDVQQHNLAPLYGTRWDDI